MVVAGVVPATLSLLLPSKLSPSPISLPNPSSRLRHFPTASSTLLFKNHDCRHFSSIGDGSSLFLIRYPNSNGLSSSHLPRWLKPIGAVGSDGSALPDPIHSTRMGKLSEKGVKFVGAISGWTATLLFMWMPVAQMWTNFLNPENIKGLSALSMLLTLLGNGLLIPRALFVRDFMWFTGSTWATFLYGWGNLICLFLFKSISPEFFWGVTAGISIWMGTSNPVSWY